MTYRELFQKCAQGFWFDAASGRNEDRQSRLGNQTYPERIRLVSGAVDEALYAEDYFELRSAALDLFGHGIGPAPPQDPDDSWAPTVLRRALMVDLNQDASFVIQSAFSESASGECVVICSSNGDGLALHDILYSRSHDYHAYGITSGQTS